MSNLKQRFGRILEASAAILIAGGISIASAQINNPGLFQSGAVTNGHLAVWGPGALQLQDGGAVPVVPVGANPTATATTSAVNGAAATFMRSDGAPAVAATTFGGQTAGPGQSAAMQGTGAKLQASTGTTTTNDCVKYDATGNAIDAGSVCAIGANPTATAGSAAVNGTAATFMRSDGAPAVAATTFGGQSVGPGQSAVVQGNGAKIQLATGTAGAAGNVAKYDASGNLIDGGAAGTGTITGVTAGTGLSGGGASGSVTLNLALTNATLIGAPVAPGTTTSAAVMAGLGSTCKITPVYSGRIHVSFNQGYFETGGTSSGFTMQIRFGTGVAPAALAATTGTAVGTAQTVTAQAGNTFMYSKFADIIGLTPGTQYWLDESFGNNNGSTTGISSVECYAEEY